MLYPHSHAWTRAQKWDIITAATLAIVVLGAAIFIYERFYRGPGEEAFFGDWQSSDFFPGDTVYFRFNPDQTFSVGGIYQGEFSPFVDGRWYAGGPNLYIRFGADFFVPSRPIVLRIVNLQANAFQVRGFRHGPDLVCRRVTLSSPKASAPANRRPF